MPQNPRSRWTLLPWLAAAGAAACSTATTPQPKVATAPAANVTAPATGAPATQGAVAGLPPDVAAAAAAPSVLPMPSGLDAAALDTKANPCTDFYRYACGGWVDSTEIPPDKARWVRSFDVLRESNSATLRKLLDAAAAGKPLAEMPYAKAVSTYYASCMDEPKLESALPELKAELGRISKLNSKKTLAQEAARLQRIGAAPLFAFNSTQDAKDATLVIGEFNQGGLGLPDRDYYLKDDDKMKSVRAAYRTHVKAVFVLLGDSPAVADRKAGEVLNFETRLANASLDRVSRRDPEKVYHRVERTGLKKLAPAFDWDDFLARVGAPGVTTISVDHQPFYAEVSAMTVDVPLNVWRTYLSWRVVSNSFEALPKRFEEERFFFVSQNLSGAKEDLPRWKKCVAATDVAFGEALGAAYVELTFGKEGKQVTRELVALIEQSFETNLAALAWMDEATKARAREKVRAIVNKVGYPDKWKSYDGLVVDTHSYLGNSWRSHAYETDRDLKKIGKPLDRTKWGMTPPTVNAYYNAQLNEMVFPAGILQPPFFERNATPAVNLGAMGMVVGHELTHGFDDRGRKFDAVGNLTDWWTPASGKGFEERVACVKTQFDGYTVVEDVKLNGGLTLGENTADLGGLKLAFMALQAYVKAHPDQVKPSRYSLEQQFFLGYAQAWCGKSRPQEARRRAQVDSHSSPEWRVNGPLSNLVPFQEAFGCKTGQPMVRSPRCEVW
jgi:putative endopeptidase